MTVVYLSPEERAYAIEMGISEVDYARVKLGLIPLREIKSLPSDFSLEEIEIAEKIILDLG